MEEKKDFIRTYTTKDKLVWGVAQFGTSVIQGIYGTTLVIFYHVYLALDPFLIGVAAFIYAVWNALNDAIFGYLSDKTRSKWGRRIPFMRFTAPFLALTFIILWLVPVNSPQLTIFLWMLILMLLYDTCYTLIGLTYSALLPELSEDDRVRGEFQKFSSLFYLLGTIIGFLLPDLIRPKVGQTDLTIFYIGMILIAIIAAVCIIFTTLRFKERPEFTQVDKPLSLGKSIKYTFKSKSFLILTSANFMSIFFQQILLSYMFYLADYVLFTDTIILLAALFIGLIIGVVIANLIAKRFGVVQANQILLIIGAVPLLLIPFIPAVVIYVCLFFAGFGLSGPLVLTNVLYSQVVDEDEVKTGVRREAAFFGTNAMLTKPAQSIAIAIGPAMLALVGFLIEQTVQPDRAIFMIKILMGTLPGIAMLLGVLILLWYPLKNSYLKEIQGKVLEMHDEKYQKLET